MNPIAEAQVRKALSSGAGLEKFRDIIAAQGGDPKVIDDYDRLPPAAHREAWRAPRAGVVSRLDAELLGRAAVALGAGRDRADAGVDPSAGIDIATPRRRRFGRAIRCCSSPATIEHGWATARALIDQAVEIGDAAPADSRLVIDRIGSGAAT